MNYNALSTIPQIADELRVKGTLPYQPAHLKVNNNYSNNPDNIDYYNQWRQEAINGVYNAIDNFNSSKKMLLEQKFRPEKGKNISIAPFQTSDPAKTQKFDSLVGGANITEGSRYTDSEYENVRKYLLNKLSKGFQEQEGDRPSRDIEQPLTLDELDELKSENDMLLSSIEDVVNRGTIDDVVFEKLLKVVSFYSNNIYKFDDEDYLNEILRKLEGLRDIGIVVKESRDESKLTSESDTEYAEVFVDTLDTLIQFFSLNIPLVGQPENERKRFAQSSRRQLNQIKKQHNFPIFEEGEPEIHGEYEKYQEALEILGMPNTDLYSYTIPELKELAKLLGIKIGSDLRKLSILDKIEDALLKFWNKEKSKQTEL